VTQGSLADEVRGLFAGDPAYQQDPYPLFARARSESPVLWFNDSTVVLFRHENARTLFADPDHVQQGPFRGPMREQVGKALSPEETKLVEDINDFGEHFLSHMNGPSHRAVRRMCQPSFSPKSVSQLEEVVQQTCDDLLAQAESEAREHGTVDFMEIASRYPLAVILTLIGAPVKDAAAVYEWTAQIGSRDPATAFSGLTSLREYGRELVAEHRRSGSQARLATDLVDRATEGRISWDHVAAIYAHLLFAGHHTTTFAIGNAVYALMLQRDQWEKLCADPTLAANAAEEVLRVNPPVLIPPAKRVVGDPITVAGQELPAGTSVWLCTAAANRDPDVYDDPDRLQVDRKPNPHITFGYGLHNCLGAPVARLELRVMLAALATRFPGLRLAVAPEAVTYTQLAPLRGISSLPVQLG
jgi:cytochrome P450